MATLADQDRIRRALAHAETALSNNRIPVGAIMFDRSGNVIAHGIKDGSKHHLFDHAEHNACYQALWAGSEGARNLEGATVYSTLEPCIMCMSLLMTTRVSQIIYAMEDPYGGGGFLLRNPDLLPARFQKQRPEISGGVLREESRALLRTFFEQDRKPGETWGDTSNKLVAACLTET